ncbi:hypothetical protein BG011_006382 [Mortierella polycephala]|uniref:MSP domain-containing protein n=1 Tax=Mortierella polycephala TaxID=41804 RepID=A0A9P6PT12_9FUNG|nr:hypothetical protein BG011_006382 [Mortierella polycephala]
MSDNTRRQRAPQQQPAAFTSSNMTNFNATNEQRPRYNDSFDQPAEPFECDVSAILPIKENNYSVFSDMEDSFDDTDFHSESDQESSHESLKAKKALSASSLMSQQRQPSYARLQQQKKKHEDIHRQNQGQSQGQGPQAENGPDAYLDDPQSENQDALHARYLEVESAWLPLQEDEADYANDQEEQFMEPQDQSPQYKEPRNDNNSYLSPNYHDDEPPGGQARLSTIAELSELPSINFTNGRQQVHRPHEPFPAGPVVISRDLELEDLLDHEDIKNEKIRQDLMANLKETDILGPVHDTHNFHLSSLTGAGRPSEPRQEIEEEVEEESRQEDQGEWDLNESELQDSRLMREYAVLFPNGAVDSEQSGSNAGGLAGYNDSDQFQEEEEEEEEDEVDEDDEFFDGSDEETDDEYYAQFDLNGGNGNMILGNNIPRKPRALAPPPGSKLPVPGSAIREKESPVPQPTPVTRVPSRISPPATNPTPSQIVPKSAPQSAAPITPRAPPTTGLRRPQVFAKSPSTSSNTLPAAISEPTLAMGSILDGLDDEPEYDIPYEESSKAKYAREVAEKIKEDEKRMQLAAETPATATTSLPQSKLPRTLPAPSVGKGMKNAPGISTNIARSSIPPPKVTITRQITEPKSPHDRRSSEQERGSNALDLPGYATSSRINSPRQSNMQVERRQSGERDREPSVPASPISPSSPRTARNTGTNSKRSSLYENPMDRYIPTRDTEPSVHRRRSSDTERDSSVPTSPRSPLSPRSPRTTETGSNRSSMYGANGDRFVPTLKESYKELVKIRQEIVDWREEIHRDGMSMSKHASSSTRAATSTRRNSRSPEKKPVITTSEPQPRQVSGVVVERLSRNTAPHSPSSSTMVPSSPSTSTARKNGQAPHSQSHPLKPSRTSTIESATTSSTTRTSYSNGNSGSVTNRQQGTQRSSRPGSPLSKENRYWGYDDQNQSGSSGQSAEDGDGCPAYLWPIELRFNSNTSGAVRSTTTIVNRSQKRMQFEILRPKGISVTPAFGHIPAGREQRLVVDIAEDRGPGRVVVELDGEWLMPLAIRFQ